jgi:hypothetical protein
VLSSLANSGVLSSSSSSALLRVAMPCWALVCGLVGGWAAGGCVYVWAAAKGACVLFVLRAGALG